MTLFINVLICVTLKVIASSWSFSQPSPSMNCLTQIGKYFYLINLLKTTLTIVHNSQQTDIFCLADTSYCYLQAALEVD